MRNPGSSSLTSDNFTRNNLRQSPRHCEPAQSLSMVNDDGAGELQVLNSELFAWFLKARDDRHQQVMEAGFVDMQRRRPRKQPARPIAGIVVQKWSASQ